jgi:hypothetical protein
VAVESDLAVIAHRLLNYVAAVEGCVGAARHEVRADTVEVLLARAECRARVLAEVLRVIAIGRLHDAAELLDIHERLRGERVGS